MQSRSSVILGIGSVRQKGFDAKKLIGDLPQFRKMDKFTQYAAAAARLAIKDAGVPVPAAAGIVLASHFGPLKSTVRFLNEIIEFGPGLTSALNFPNTVFNMAAGRISIAYRLKGPAVTLAGGLDQAFEEAVRLLSGRKAPIILAGYVEEENEVFPRLAGGAVFYVLKGVSGNGTGKRI